MPGGYEYTAELDTQCRRVHRHARVGLNADPPHAVRFGVGTAFQDVAAESSSNGSEFGCESIDGRGLVMPFGSAIGDKRKS